MIRCYYMLHRIQKELLELSKKENLAEISLRKTAELIGFPDSSPQRIKHHLLQLKKKGFLTIDKKTGTMKRHFSNRPGKTGGFLKEGGILFSIPVIGMANCGPATIFAETNFQGSLYVSKKVINKTNVENLYAIKAKGSSMNLAEVNGEKIEDGDFVIIDSRDKNIINKDIVLVVVDNTATIKRFIKDKKNKQIVLRADSSFDYEPIYLHPDDEFFVSGKVIGVIKSPEQ